MGLGAILSVVCLNCVCSLAATDTVLLSGDAIHIRDVAKLDCLPSDVRSAFDDLVIGKLPEGIREVRIPSATIIDRIRQRAPGLDINGASNSPGEITLQRQNTPSEPRPDPSCFIAAHSIRMDAAISAEDLSPTPCGQSSADRTVYYDRPYGTLRAATNLVEGAYVGRISVPQHVYANVGDEILLVVNIGSVRIERQVNAMQSATRDGGIFVRDVDGTIFSARLQSYASEGDDK